MVLIDPPADPGEAISSISLKLSNGEGLSQERLSHFIVKTRQYLELNDNDRRLDLLWFFCNWYLHTELTRNPTGWRLAFDMNRFHRNPTHGHRHSKALNLPEFRNQYRELLQTNGSSVDWVKSDQLWKKFMSAMFRELEGKPVGYEDQVLEGKGGAKVQKGFAKLKEDFPTTCLFRFWIAVDADVPLGELYRFAGLVLPASGSGGVAFVEPILEADGSGYPVEER